MLVAGGTLEAVYSIFFRAPDWTDAAAVGLVVAAAVLVTVLPFGKVTERWILLPLACGIAAVTFIAIGDEAAVGVSYLFLPAAVVMVFFWHDVLTKSVVLASVSALYIGVPAVWGDRDAFLESAATLPLLVTTSLLIGFLFNRFRVSSVQHARFRGTIMALLKALEARDGHTAEHASDVLAIVTEVAEQLGLDSREQLYVADVALLHDIGKIGIPNEILHKPAALSDPEWEVVKRHPEIGERILNEVPGFERVATAVRHEHERWDGRGYPDGLRGAEIPLASRIVLACDAYNAMISPRPYREPLSESAAREQLLRNAGAQFDPEVVDALLTVLERRSFERLNQGAGKKTAAVSADTPPTPIEKISPLSRRAASL